MSGRNAEIDSSWKLLASTTVKLASLETSTREISGVPIFPATCTGNPRGFQDVADERSGRGLAVRAGDANQPPAQKPPGQFDLAPHGNADARARRPAPASSAARRDSARSNPAAAKVSARWPPSSRVTPAARNFAAVSAISVSGRASVAVTRAPRSAQNSAVAMPVRASPTTSTCLPCEFDDRFQRVTSISASSAKTAQRPAPQSKIAR